jgi:hypothetical protein
VDITEDVGKPWHTPKEFIHGEYVAFLDQVRLMCAISDSKNRPIYRSNERRRESEWRVPIANLYTYFGITTKAGPEVKK